ncbi:hypothetical protein V2J09_003276 [Rumex salicifolius]
MVGRFISRLQNIKPNFVSQSLSSSGEIHPIVGPRFACNATFLPPRIESEPGHDSFQAQFLQSSILLDRSLKDLCINGRLKQAIQLLYHTGSPVDWQTYSLLLQECIHRKEYELGKRIHAQMIVVGFVLNEYLQTKLLILYSKAGNLEIACKMFDTFEKKSLISWNAIIAGHVQKGLEVSGLSLYNDMRCSGVTPDQFTFSSVFRACATLALLDQGRQSHGIWLKCQLSNNVVVTSAIIDMYFKCSSPHDGHQVFEETQVRNVITWTALISGYGHNGKIKEVLSLFHQMIAEGFRPDQVTFLVFVTACSHGGLVSEGWKHFLSMEKDYGIQPRLKHFGAMVDLLGRAGRLDEAYEFIKDSPFKNHSVIWGSLLAASRIHGNVDLVKLSAQRFFELEPENGTAGKYLALSNAYAAQGLWGNAADVWGTMQMKKDPGYSRIQLNNRVHFFFMRDNTHDESETVSRIVEELDEIFQFAGFRIPLSFHSRRLFAGINPNFRCLKRSLSFRVAFIPRRRYSSRADVSQSSSCGEDQLLQSSFQFDKTLKGLCISGRLRQAIQLLCHTGLAVDWQTYSLLLQDCIHRGAYELGKIIHSHMIAVGFALNEYLETKLLILYAKAGRLRTASKIFEKFEKKSVISWNAIISGHVQKGLEEVGLNLYNEMRYSGVTPDHFTFSSVFKACATLALLEQGRQAHGVWIKCEISDNVVVSSAIMDMYFKCSCPIEGHHVFEESVNRNVITWTALITGYGNNGKVKEVLNLFEEMVTEGFRPNYVTYLAVLTACSHGGLVSEGWKHFLSMEKDYGIKPRAKHYAAMVDLLGRAGRLEEAYEFIRNSPFQDHPVIWGSLLGACRIYGNVDLVKHSAEKFFDLEPENAGKYVVLANAYAAHGLWGNAAEVRGSMRDSQLRKDPAYSRIELHNKVHFFFMADSTHNEAESVSKLLEELYGSLRDAGCIPDVSDY